MKKILIAEDYTDSREYMKFLLESYGYEVYEAANGQAAIEIARQHHPDLILMDISMPVMDGLEATRIIRSSDDDISKTPIVALTAFGEEYKGMALKAGCNQFIIKPIDLETIETIVDKYLGR